MNHNQTSRFTAMGLCISLLALVWMLLVSLMFMPQHQTMNFTLPVAAPIDVAKTHHTTNLAALPRTLADTNLVALHSFQQQYTYVFTGQVTCGANPCRDAAVQVHVQTDKNPGIVKEAALGPDGNYMVVVLFKEAPHEQIDWKINADSKDSASTELHGQQILEDDPDVVVENPIQLL